MGPTPAISSICCHDAYVEEFSSLFTRNSSGIRQGCYGTFSAADTRKAGIVQGRTQLLCPLNPTILRK